MKSSSKQREPFPTAVNCGPSRIATTSSNKITASSNDASKLASASSHRNQQGTRYKDRR